ncbi:MAG TPA: dihydrodipicolinate synthase family protein [Flavobacteriales bacterium]|nr:dihydrodipicolinate synthase family protein [Flavobacteriales bacterium]HIN40120.1 dihydrodipicolinate synthase family protein [Flavobacteriales bacterium]
MKIEWTGIFPAVTTKFNDDDDLDLKWIQKNVEEQIIAGVSGIILGGTLGEASVLSKKEKQTITSAVLAQAKERVPVILNVAEQRTSDAVDFVKEAEQLGANGLMLLPPMRYLADDRETLTYLKTVAQATTLPIMIYNNPIDYKILVTMEMFGELASIENVQAVKESTREISNIGKMLDTFGDRFAVFSGVDTLAFESLVAGAVGWVAGLVCAFPTETVAIYKLVKSGQIEEARKINDWFMPLLELDINTKLVQNIKLAEVATGLGTENVRPPRLPLVGEERKKVLEIIETAMASRPALPNFTSAIMS